VPEDTGHTGFMDKPLYERLDSEVEFATRKLEIVEPTDEEKRNGWTAESLTKYLSERQAGQSLSVDVNSLHRRVARRPDMQTRYNPKRWRE